MGQENKPSQAVPYAISAIIGLIGIPAAMAIAILRRRLFDIDGRRSAWLRPAATLEFSVSDDGSGFRPPGPATARTCRACRTGWPRTAAP